MTKDFVKEGAIVIDVGMNRDENGKLIGVVKFDEVSEITAIITPVPRGVGPMTITMLMGKPIERASGLKEIRCDTSISFMVKQR